MPIYTISLTQTAVRLRNRMEYRIHRIIKKEMRYIMKNNKWIRAAIPALLLHCSIGTVYCWSIFSQEIADYIGFSKGATE